MDTLTYTIIHKESDRVIANGLNETETINLVQKMINTNLVTGISLADYILLPSGGIDVLNLLVDIRKQGVFDFNHTWHVG
ncbi:hypothetical protein F867_gp056 [Staphylococcus phage JD007]|uniref:TreG n=1 Tax=Staphylococcus phage JD007 TaxID=1239383 RepID=K7QNI7_9CAUD|nr:hypothetical protein F867_gp056 [Staphylococcus phage JD007]AFV50800.1 hypothetical protein [Staphylococcus phage JD007]